MGSQENNDNVLGSIRSYFHPGAWKSAQSSTQTSIKDDRVFTRFRRDRAFKWSWVQIPVPRIRF